ncbi:unnamed protein product [Rangifer tarandus platyrhynchus]|uniref:Uncharacterized protein n=2 Tax=Rangifer tarandus platyrhynchus TaxID=3082113 RepID=A0ABN8ZHU9_RANTA|nr:unnamed protein product [Rangifer tarandus platyrhynchus]CAI9705964.1 unnamed protein product [Rangifer tarandus platyrhynchus]
MTPGLRRLAAAGHPIAEVYLHRSRAVNGQWAGAARLGRREARSHKERAQPAQERVLLGQALLLSFRIGSSDPLLPVYNSCDPGNAQSAETLSNLVSVAQLVSGLSSLTCKLDLLTSVHPPSLSCMACSSHREPDSVNSRLVCILCVSAWPSILQASEDS